MFEISRELDGTWNGCDGSTCITVLPDGETRLWNRVMQQPFRHPPVHKNVLGCSVGGAYIYITPDRRIALFDNRSLVPPVLRAAKPYPPYVKLIRWMGVNIYRPTPRNIIITKQELE